MSELLRFSRSPWLASPLIAVATFVCLWSLTSLVVLGDWVRTSALALAIVTTVVLLSRLASRSKIVPTLLGGISSFLLLVVIYAKDDAGNGFLLPTPDGVTALVDTFRAGLDYAVIVAPPGKVTPELASLLTAVLLGLFLLAEHIAVSWRAVASAGFPLFVPWIPAIIGKDRVSTVALLIGLTAWIGAMTLSRKNAPAERGISLGTATAATLASLALLGLAAPAALGGRGWGSIPDIDAADIFDTPTRLSLDLDLRNSLNNDSEAPILLYVSSGPRPSAFRLYTLTDFDGASWEYTAPEPTNRSASQGLLWPESVTGWNDAEHVRLDVTVYSLVVNTLPIPTSPRTIDVNGNWTYHAPTDTIIGDDETTRNLTYTIVMDPSFHSATTLRAAEEILESDPDQDATDPAFLEFPPAVDLGSIRSLAEGLTEGESTRYDQALAIQNYLRNPSVFTYTTDVDLASGDVVSAFLESKRGYCLHFATTMVVMLRSLDIPARLGYGFLAGDYDSDSEGYIVRGKNAHVWPEVYFPSHGWVRFEPTPSIQSGSPPSWADPYADTVIIPVPRSVIEGGAYPVGPLPTDPVDPGTEPQDADDGPLLPAWVIRVLGVVLALGLFGVIVLVRRRAVATERALHGPEGAWQRLADRLGDLAWPASATPLEARSWVLRGIERLAGRPPGHGGEDALSHLSGAVSDYRYAPGGTDVTQHQLDSWVSEVITEAETAAAEATDRPSRGGARTAPRAGS